MSDRKQALTDLLGKVEAGEEIGHHDTLPLVRAWRSPLEYFDITYEMEAAYNGSLDAAKALQEAVLGGWRFHIASEANGNGFIVTVSSPDWGEYWVGHAKEAARAWLIAVLKALIEQESNQ